MKRLFIKATSLEKPQKNDDNFCFVCFFSHFLSKTKQNEYLLSAEKNENKIAQTTRNGKQFIDENAEISLAEKN